MLGVTKKDRNGYQIGLIMKVSLVAVPWLTTLYPPLSLALLSGELKSHGYDVRCFDFNIDAFNRAKPEHKKYWEYYYSYKWFQEKIFNELIFPEILKKYVLQWAQKILSHSPDVIGISVINCKIAEILSSIIRKMDPSVKIIFGGPICYTPYFIKKYLEDRRADVVVSKEGEVTLLELLNDYKNDGEFKVIKGAHLLNGDKVAYGGDREQITELDNFAYPDFSDFDLKLYKDPKTFETGNVLPISLSRGCNNRCNFCVDYKMWGGVYRQKSAHRMVEEIKYLSAEYQINNFTFVQLMLNGHHNKLKKVTKHMLEQNIKFTFHSHGRIDKRLDIELLDSLQKMGLKHLNIGLESASNRVLKKMRKGYSSKTASECIKAIHSAGISISVSIIVGFPGETFYDFLKTLWFLIRHFKYITFPASVMECNASPGSDLELYPEKFDIILNNENTMDWKSFDKRNTLKVRRQRRKLLLKTLSFVSSCKNYTLHS